jgi:hypothetical protein
MEVLTRLLNADISVQYQVQRDLLGNESPALQNRIHTEGWGKQLLDLQKPDGHWGLGWYAPKWICTHYTLLILKNLALIKEIPSIQTIFKSGLEHNICPDGGISF